jgi:hypothetical protein
VTTCPDSNSNLTDIAPPGVSSSTETASAGSGKATHLVFPPAFTATGALPADVELRTAARPVLALRQDDGVAENAPDWRLRGQEAYLSERRFKWRKWWPHRPGWVHDHCAFCWAEFAAEVTEHTPYDAGWVTADDEYTWVCTVCFEDFKEQFAWEVDA